MNAIPGKQLHLPSFLFFLSLLILSRFFFAEGVRLPPARPTSRCHISDGNVLIGSGTDLSAEPHAGAADRTVLRSHSCLIPSWLVSGLPGVASSVRFLYLDASIGEDKGNAVMKLASTAHS